MLDEKCEAVATAADADEDWRSIRDPAAEGSRPLIRFLVERIGGGDDEEGLEPPDRRDWRHIRTFETRFDAGGVARSGLAVFKWPDDPSDEDSRSVLSAPQSLRDHAEQVADCTRALARRLELPGGGEADALVLAARMGLRCQATGRERRWASFSADHMNTVEPETASFLLVTVRGGYADVE